MSKNLFLWGLSKVADGNMVVTGKRGPGLNNRQKFFKWRGVVQAASAGLVHSNRVVLVTPSKAGKVLADCDGLVAKQPDIFLSLTVADCFPVYFYNQKTQSVGLAHSGWRGTVKNIAGHLVKKIGGSPKDLWVVIGPGIQACHFEIQKNIVKKFSAYPQAILKRDNKIFVDLPKIISTQLLQAGVPKHNIQSSGVCTYDHPELYFSYRRDKPKNLRTMVAYIGVRSGLLAK